MEDLRTCLDCGEPLHGRTDKKFCDDQCRSHYNNLQNKAALQSMKTINAILRKNRNVLSALNPDGKVKIPRKRLLQKGFDFGYHTHTYQTRGGSIYTFCYEQGYLPLDNELILLVKNREV